MRAPAFLQASSRSLPGSKLLTVPPDARPAASIVYWYWMSMMPSLSPCLGSSVSAKPFGAFISLGLNSTTLPE